MYARYVKRFFDIIGSFILLLLLSPLIVVLSIVIKLNSHGPVLFTQKRTGLNGNLFLMFKFRSMTQDNDVHDKSSENQITSLGKFLRTTSLDELPQLYNVLKGDMSFIGPRPWIHTYFEHMTPRQRQRNNVRPGITGIAQVYGRNNLTIHQKISYDLRYVTHLNLREDMKVIYLTVLAVVSKEGQEIGKSGIHQELLELKQQITDDIQDLEEAANPETRVTA